VRDENQGRPCLDRDRRDPEVRGHRQVTGINVQTVGVVLMIVGVIGLLITFVRLSVRRRTDVIHRGRDVTYLEPADPADPRY
jgi:hypothetical protein